MRKSVFSIFDEIEQNREIIYKIKKYKQKWKKSIFNIFRKVYNNNIIFNTLSLAVCIIDNDFFEIYDNLDNIDVENFDEKRKKIYDTMRDCNFIVNNDVDEINTLKSHIFNRLNKNKKLNLTIFPTLYYNFECKCCKIKNNIKIISKKVHSKILELIRNYSEKKFPININWEGGEPLLTFDLIYDLSQKSINICKKNNVKYISQLTTNGFLFTNEVISKLKECNILTVNILINKSYDNYTGPHFFDNDNNNKKETFNNVLENIVKLKNNKIKVKIRIDIDRNFNINSVVELLKIFKKNNLQNDYYYVISGFDSQDSNKKLYPANKNCFTNIEYAEFILNFYKNVKNSNIQNSNNFFYPNFKRLTYCDLSKCTSLKIYPDGYLYKCSVEAGKKEKAIGNIFDKNIFDKKIISNNMEYITWNPSKFKECISCSLLPICSGNCPKIETKNNKINCEESKKIIDDLIDYAVGKILKN